MSGAPACVRVRACVRAGGGRVCEGVWVGVWVGVHIFIKGAKKRPE